MTETLRVELYLGDCLDVMPTLAHRSVAMVFADLPYATAARKTTDCGWDVPVCLQLYWGAVKRIAPAATYIATATQPFCSALVQSNSKQFRYDIIWDRIGPTGHFNANRAPLRRHEHVLIFCASAPPYNPQKTADSPYFSKHKAPATAFKKRQEAGLTKRLDTLNIGNRFPVSIIAFASDRNRFHPTQKPVALLEYLIKTYTNKYETVLDPCAGSFTTAVAAIRTGRSCIAIEKDSKYFAAGAERVKAEIAASGANVELVVHG